MGGAGDLREEVRGFLDAQTTLTLAFADSDGPWAADVWFVRDGASLAFFSSPESRHARAFAAGAPAAATVHAPAREPPEIRGVQMSGSVRPVAAGPEHEGTLDLYVRKYPFARDLLFGAARLLDRVRFYRFTPDRVLWVENARGFGKRVETGF